MRIFYWIHHTGTYEGNSGVQRVVRNLAAALDGAGHELVPVRWDSGRESIVHADESWLDGLAHYEGPLLHPAPVPGEPLHLAEPGSLREGAWLLVPEVPHVAEAHSPNLAIALDYARFHGLRTAVVFYDLIPLRQAGYETMAAAHAGYARSLVAAEAVLAISGHSARDLERWWAEQQYDRRRLPPVTAVPLPAEILGVPRGAAGDRGGTPVRFVALGTVEPRKNQLELMRAFTRLRSRRPDLDLQLDVVGNVRSDLASEVAAIAQEDGITIRSYIPDDEARRLVADAHASVFLSLYEGFGLPVAESLWLGTPCLCSDNGAVAEVAAGGGCLTVPASDTAAIEQALELLADDDVLRARLADEARRRPLTTWADYAGDIVEALADAPRLRRLVAIEGTRSQPDPPSLDGAATIERLHWRPESRALLPGSRAEPEPPRLRAGDLEGAWALVRAGTGADPGELDEIAAAAAGLGLRVALAADADTPAATAASFDVVLFGTEADRDSARAAALRSLPRTVGIRERLVAPADRVVDELARREPGIAAAREPDLPKRVFYWVGLTVEQPFNTGVQRVSRRLAVALQEHGVDVVPVKWDGVAGRMAPLTEAESEHLARWHGPITAPRPLPRRLDDEWLVIPEITVPVVPPQSNVARLGRSLGMRVAAIFYDLIPEKMPENYPPVALEALREYWLSFAEVDVALPISWSTAADLPRWLAENGCRRPRIVPCPLAGDSGATLRRTVARRAPRGPEPVRLLATGTWEPRKNYPRLLRALADARSRAARPLELTIVGRRAGFDALDAEIEELAAAAGATLHGHVEDEELDRLHEDASATVFASWEEGFGLPVLESLWYGLPCLCHAGSAMAELTPGGGVLAIDMFDERAIADALVQLADRPELLERLAREAVERPIRTWLEYADDVLQALSGTAPRGWPLPAIARNRPLLTCAITTYNRAPWLAHSLERLLEATRPWRDVVEIVVCDNASTDETSKVTDRFRREESFHAYRNAENVGMLGNLGATARASEGAFVWLLGDDDLLIDGALENVLEGLAAHPDVEMAYMNYAYTHFDEPAALDDVAALIAAATPIAPGGENRYVRELREVSPLNENLFTAIYTCAFRRDHALRAYQLDTRGAPFTSLLTCVPSSVYALRALQDRPAWWVGEPAVVVNMNVSWLRWALLWHLERMPDLFELAEQHGVDGDALDPYRLLHLREIDRWLRMVYFDAEDAIRENVSLARVLERSKHLLAERLPAIRGAYEDAWEAGRVVADPVPPDELFARYGV